MEIPLTITHLQKSPMSPQVVVSVCWSTFWRGCRWSPAMSNSRWEQCSFMSKFNPWYFLVFFVCVLNSVFFSSHVCQVLKIFVHLCGHGSNHFLTELRRNSTFIQQASGKRHRSLILTLWAFTNLDLICCCFFCSFKCTAALLIPSTAQHCTRKWGTQHR